MENILEVRNLHKFYKDFKLTNVDFTLQEGCITGFIGINGSGKTTTIRSILNLVKKNSGTIKIFGKDIDKCGIEIKNRIGIVLDDGCFYDGLTMNEMKSIIAPAYSNWNEKEYKNYMDYFSSPDCNLIFYRFIRLLISPKPPAYTSLHYASR